jgi:hypothetical protein
LIHWGRLPVYHVDLDLPIAAWGLSPDAQLTGAVSRVVGQDSFTGKTLIQCVRIALLPVLVEMVEVLSANHALSTMI